MRPNTFTFAVSAAALAMTAGLLVAGPINPPAGPVGPSYKTLSDIEPRIAVGPSTTPGDATSVYRITQPGSYYLTGNVAVSSGQAGVRIDADGVTLDLNGFTVAGVAGSTSGVVCAVRNRIEIRNGTVHGIAGVGIEALQASAVCVRNVHVDDCLISGIRLGTDCRAEDCTSRDNAGTGISVEAGGVIRGCDASGNLDGFDVGGGSAAEGCLAHDNTRDGFVSSDGVNFSACSATANGRDGIVLTWGSQARGCFAHSNTRHGIAFGSYCTIEGNTVRGNDGAGLYSPSNGQRTVVRGNSSSQNGVGLQLDGGANLVLGNTCTSNTTNFIIVANNRVATIVTMPLSGAINGNAGGTALSAPDANYAY